MSYSFIEKNNTNSYLSISSTQGAACVDGIKSLCPLWHLMTPTDGDPGDSML